MTQIEIGKQTLKNIGSGKVEVINMGFLDCPSLVCISLPKHNVRQTTPRQCPVLTGSPSLRVRTVNAK